MIMVAQCNGQELLYSYVIDEQNIFVDTQFDEQTIFTSLVFEIAVIVSVGNTAYLLLCWMLKLFDASTQCCLNTCFLVGYPVLWTVIKIRQLDNDLTDTDLDMFDEKSITLLLPLAVSMVLMVLSVIIIRFRRAQYEYTELNFKTITLLGQFVVACCAIFLCYYAVFNHTHGTKTSKRVHLFLYHSCTKTVMLFNSCGKVYIFLVGEYHFGKHLRSRMKKTWLRECLCLDGLNLYSG